MDGTEFESSRGIGGGFVENYAPPEKNPAKQRFWKVTGEEEEEEVLAGTGDAETTLLQCWVQEISVFEFGFGLVFVFLIFATDNVAPREITVTGAPQHKEPDVQIGRMQNYWSAELLDKPVRDARSPPSGNTVEPRDENKQWL